MTQQELDWFEMDKRHLEPRPGFDPGARRVIEVWLAGLQRDAAMLHNFMTAPFLDQGDREAIRDTIGHLGQAYNCLSDVGMDLKE